MSASLRNGEILPLAQQGKRGVHYVIKRTQIRYLIDIIGKKFLRPIAGAEGGGAE